MKRILLQKYLKENDCVLFRKGIRDILFISTGKPEKRPPSQGIKTCESILLVIFANNWEYQNQNLNKTLIRDCGL
jgi:hypothetical protein